MEMLVFATKVQHAVREALGEEYRVELKEVRKNNGVILSSIFGREDSRSYVKPIEAGKSSYTLTEEEQQALHQAMVE